MDGRHCRRGLRSAAAARLFAELDLHRVEIPGHVITSYSIHYTKLYDALIVLSLALLVPLALLAWRALDGLALEREVRHRAVAERAFDEMERALSEFLAGEEARPFEAYRFYVSAPGDRSPLSAPAGLEPRITSYNVCYTKLLRSLAWPLARIEGSARWIHHSHSRGNR